MGRDTMANNVLEVCDRLVIGNHTEKIDIPFIGAGNIWVRNSYTSETISLARYIINEAIQKTAPGQLSIIGFDSDLSGLFAPFANLTSGAAKQLELISNKKELETNLEYLGQHIQAVQNVIQGRRDTLTQFRDALGRPVESYKLIVLFMDLSTADPKFLERLAVLMKRGPDAGVSFLIIPSNNKLDPDGIRQPQYIDENICELGFDKNGHINLMDNRSKLHISSVVPPSPINPSTLVALCDDFILRLNGASLPTIYFDEINDIDMRWQYRSENGLTFSVGKYGVSDVEITIGDEINQRHNALITGAVGQGKSNLLSVIIHSLCLRYPPSELSLYLLDFKEGVSLKPFVNIGQEEYLPHAKAVGLESNAALGIAVLEFLYSEYLRRLKIFKAQDVKSLKEYRAKFPNEAMPRIVAVIDEFQLMFGDDDSTGEKVVDLLEKSVRLFRAAGIHFILASQSISGNAFLGSKKDSIFSQVPIRIAHKNSITESQNTLGIANSAAAYLRAREAIVNVDYGEVSQNRKTVIAWANEKLLQPLRNEWWKAAQHVCPPPYVYENDKAISAATARVSGRIYKSSVMPHGLLGEMIAITGEKLAVPLPSETGRNIAILGSQDAEHSNAEGIMQGIALSLAAQHERGAARFLFCDFRSRDNVQHSRTSVFPQQMLGSGFQIEKIPAASFQSELKSILEKPPQGGRAVKTYVFALGLDKWECEADIYDPPLKSFVNTAPGRGIHFIGWWVKASNFNAHVGDPQLFNTKVFLRIESDSVINIIGAKTLKWNSTENRALLVDEVEFARPIEFIPYAAM